MVTKEVVSAYVGSLENHTLENDYFREVLYTGKYAQLVLMCLKPGEEIGNGVHAEAVISFTLSAGSRIRLERKRNTHVKKRRRCASSGRHES